jgi:hypothetical protein
MKKTMLGGLAALTMTASAMANDTSAVLEAGGLVYTRQDSVDMLSEDLFISQEEITVDYVFKNQAETDLDTVVAARCRRSAVPGFSPALDDYERQPWTTVSGWQEISPNCSSGSPSTVSTRPTR